MLTRWRRIALGGLAVLVGAYAVSVLLFAPLPLEGADPDDGYTRVAGVIHVHTSMSDGGGTPERVVEAARRAGLDFLAITDHNNLDAQPVEGVQGKTLVLVGTEASTVAGHVLGLGLTDPVFRFSRDPHETLVDIRDLGGIAFLAHPTSPRADLRWQAWDEPGPWGMEVLNNDSAFRQASWPARVRSALTYLLNPRYSLLTHMKRPDETLARWDGLLARRAVPAIAGADAHGQIELTRTVSLKAPSYGTSFAVARTHVLLDRPFSGAFAADRQALLAALGAGRAYAGLDGLADANAFSFTAEAEGQRWTMGGTAPLAAAPRLRAGGRMPARTALMLFRDGALAAQAMGALDYPVKAAGIYRVEAYVPGWKVPWIITNPIAVLDEAGAAARMQPPPAPAPVPSPAQVLSDFAADSGFFVSGADDRSFVAPPLWDAAGGTSGGAARLAFKLGVPSGKHPHVFAALVNRQDRDLGGRQGLVLSVRADGVYRFWVQVRDANPASPDEGTEWWFSSVRTSTEWQRVALPFARLRSIQKNSDGKLDPDKVRALVFIVDAGAMKAGSTGTIWIDDLGVY
jgi:PHP domain-containing protein